jgi:uncharacterized glyoxalase superfamily protein PhnB
MIGHMTTHDDRAEPPSLGEFGGFEIYPMPMFATLAVADVSGVAAWYATALGFGTVFQAPGGDGQPPLVHLRRRKYQDLLLVPAASDHAPAGHLTLSFSVDSDLDALAAQAHAAARHGQSAVIGPVDTPWNTRDLRVTDPVGTRLVFTARNPNPDPEQMARMKAMFEAAGKRPI